MGMLIPFITANGRGVYNTTKKPLKSGLNQKTHTLMDEIVQNI